MTISQDDFLQLIRKNGINEALLEALRPLGLPQAFLVAGCLFQTVWNIKGGNLPGHAIKDYDIAYYDDDDLSWQAENAVIQQVRDVTGDLGVEVEVKNQARVHLWYTERFGTDYAPLSGVEDGIDRYLISCTCVGIRIADETIYAPDGFRDMWNGVLRMNPSNPTPMLFKQKCEDYRARWPWLSVAG